MTSVDRTRQSPVSELLTWGFVPAAVPERAGPRGARCPCAWTGDAAGGAQGTAGGRRARRVHGRRDVHVSTTAQRRPPTASQHVDIGPGLRKGPPSPGSTAVMTRMKEISRRILEPQSGWGSCVERGPRRSAGARGFPPSDRTRHDEQRTSTGDPADGEDDRALIARAELKWVES